MTEIRQKSPAQIIRLYRTEILRDLRREGARVRKAVRAAAPRRTGQLRRGIKMRTGWDASGPYARITTSARRKGAGSQFRYGLAIQQQQHYLQQGLARTPRR